MYISLRIRASQGSGASMASPGKALSPQQQPQEQGQLSPAPALPEHGHRRMSSGSSLAGVLSRGFWSRSATEGPPEAPPAEPRGSSGAAQDRQHPPGLKKSPSMHRKTTSTGKAPAVCPSPPTEQCPPLTLSPAIYRCTGLGCLLSSSVPGAGCSGLPVPAPLPDPACVARRVRTLLPRLLRR